MLRYLWNQVILWYQPQSHLGLEAQVLIMPFKSHFLTLLLFNIADLCFKAFKFLATIQQSEVCVCVCVGELFVQLDVDLKSSMQPLVLLKTQA